MKAIFYNLKEGRIKAGWRILVFCVLFWCLSASILFIRPLIGDIDKSEFLTDYSLLIVFVLAISATLSVYLVRRYIDKSTFLSLGLQWRRNSWRDLLFGFVLSGLMAGSFFAIVMGMGFVSFESFNPEIVTDLNIISLGKGLFSGILLVSFMEMVLVGYWEELVFRGYLFENMKQGMGLVLAVAISCLLYGLLHSMNPNATFISSAIIIAFGFLRIYGLLLTQMLWLSMGMHIGWNFFQGPVFGFNASGHEHSSLLLLSRSGPEWLSGGSFGPEGSIIILPIVFLAIVAMKKWNNYKAMSKESRGFSTNYNPVGEMV